MKLVRLDVSNADIDSLTNNEPHSFEIVNVKIVESKSNSRKRLQYRVQMHHRHNNHCHEDELKTKWKMCTSSISRYIVSGKLELICDSCQIMYL